MSIPLKELAGEGNSLVILFRVTPVDHPSDLPILLSATRFPASRDAGGDASLQGTIDLGEGKYHVDG